MSPPFFFYYICIGKQKIWKIWHVSCLNTMIAWYVLTFMSKRSLKGYSVTNSGKWGEWISPPPTSNAPTPTGCPQFCHWLPGDQIPQVKDSVAQDCPCPPLFRCHLQAQVITCASGQSAINLRFPPSPPQVQIICYSISQNSGTLCT